MGTLWVQCSFVNETRGHRFSDTPWEPTRWEGHERGGLFRELQREFGRCVSAMYVDTPKGAKAVGWVFQSRQEYDDAWRIRDKAERTYIREVWVSVEEREEELEEAA